MTVAAANNPGLIVAGAAATLMLSIGSSAALARWNSSSVSPVINSARFLISTATPGTG